MAQQTPLYEQHTLCGARMVDFHGWMMPLHYGSQIDQAIEMQLGQSTEEMFGTSYEDMMEQLVALRDAATGTGGQ